MDAPVEFINGYNLDRCLELDRDRNRIVEMSSGKCDGLRKHTAEDKQKRQLQEVAFQRQVDEQQADLARLNKMSEDSRKWRDIERTEQERQRDQKEQERKDADEKYLAKYQADRAAEKIEQAKQEAEWDRQERVAKNKQNARIAEVKARCGNDYKNPRIGMNIERVKECIAPVKMVSQVNRADGVCYTYAILFVRIETAHQLPVVLNTETIGDILGNKPGGIVNRDHAHGVAVFYG